MSPSEEKFLLVETVEFWGHPNVLGTHYNTIEVTKVAEISKRADCIIGVRASKSCADLSPDLKRHIQNGGAMCFVLTVNGESFSFRGRGRKELKLTDQHEIVLRRSDFISDRTAAISCDSAAIDIPRRMIRFLQSSAKGVLAIRAIDSFGPEETPSLIFIES